MTTVMSRTFLDGEDEVLLLPDEVSFEADVDVVLTRTGDVITLRRLHPDIEPNVINLDA